VDFGQRKFAANPGAFAPSALQLSDILNKKDGPLTGVLLISLGSHKTEGAELDSIAQWLSGTFDKIRIMPADYIYRWTLQLLNPTLDDTEAIRYAVQACNEFKAHASPILAQYSNSCEFEWFPMSTAIVEQQEAFEASYIVLEELLKSSSDFAETVQHYSDAYSERVGISAKGNFRGNQMGLPMCDSSR
jgi:hypothetical protein